MGKIWNTNLYEEKHSFVYSYGKELVGWLNPLKDESILDVGCGTGQLTAEIANTGCAVIGMDSSPEMIMKARRNYPNIKFEVHNAADFCFDNAFDAVFSNSVLHWVNDSVGAIQSINSALKPDGRFVAEFGGEYNVLNILTSLKESFSLRNIQMVRKNGPWYFPSTAEYAYLLERNGFLVKRIHHINRDTVLDDVDFGIRDWLQMFADEFFVGFSETEKSEIMKETQERIRQTNFVNGQWIADYCRIRVEAVKR